MNKFENVDVLASLQQIMQQNTAAFQNDFDIDKKILTGRWNTRRWFQNGFRR